MKIAFTSLYNINPLIWSGTIFQIYKGLEKQNCELLFAEDFKIPFNYYYKAKSFTNHKLLKSAYFKQRELRIVKSYAEHFNNKMKDKHYDLIFSPQTHDIRFIESEKPFFIWVDATFKKLEEQLKNRERISKRTAQLGNDTDFAAYNKSKAIFFASHWAAESCSKDYGIDKNKIHVVPFGANIDHHLNDDDIKNCIYERSRTELNLLFIAVNWEQKGGDILVELAENLNNSGIKTNINAIGSYPKKIKSPHFVKFHGFLNKQNQSDYNKYQELMLKSHFLVNLSRQEAYGISFCEANSYGVPAIGTDIGGIPTIIKNNYNGILVSNPPDIKRLADNLSKIFLNEASYRQLAFNALSEYRSRLNWQVSCKKVIDIIKNNLL